MCGIAGVAGRADGRELLARMLPRLAHRGPDGTGWLWDPYAQIALGHQRLAVLDLSDQGRQPMQSQDGRWTMALNGEIFNHRELAARWGGDLRSRSDTEVLLECCAQWGVEKTLERAAGMFAFALWDARENELILARDRVGEKPLVYFESGGTLAFASEIKALEEFHGSRLDPAAVDAYLALGYVPAPLAIFLGCRKLEPGHLLRRRAGQVTIERWWFPERQEAGFRRRLPDPEMLSPVGRRIEKLRSHVQEAVKTRLDADVPVALALSGGVDSSIIASECARLGARPEAFTVRFGADSEDVAHATLVAKRLGLRQEVLEVTPETVARDLDRVFWHYDEPFADSSMLPSFALARALAQRCKVVLNGDGGDEAFAGYPHYAHIAAKQWAKAAAAAAGWCDGRGNRAAGVYVESKVLFREAERMRLLEDHRSGTDFGQFIASSAYPIPRDQGPLKMALWTDRHLQLPNDLAYKMDTALGAWGLEGRAPFLDHRLLEWAQSLPESDLVRGRRKKVLLRAAYEGDLPPEVLGRPKQGFGVPIDAWLRGPCRDWAQDAIASSVLPGKIGAKLTGQRLWMLAAFSRWAREWRARW